jgi:hypothetical protein
LAIVAKTKTGNPIATADYPQRIRAVTRPALQMFEISPRVARAVWHPQSAPRNRSCEWKTAIRGTTHGGQAKHQQLPLTVRAMAQRMSAELARHAQSLAELHQS